MRFELVSSVLVVMNTVTMMLYYWKSPPANGYMHRVDQADEILAIQRHDYIVALDWINIGFTGGGCQPVPADPVGPPPAAPLPRCPAAPLPRCAASLPPRRLATHTTPPPSYHHPHHPTTTPTILPPPPPPYHHPTTFSFLPGNER